MKNTDIEKIDEIEFKDVKVGIYYSENSVTGCAWRMRNPDSCYTGLMYINFETGERSYPEDAVIPEQTDRDREMLPQFFLVDSKEYNEDNLLEYLETEYKIRNGK